MPGRKIHGRHYALRSSAPHWRSDPAKFERRAGGHFLQGATMAERSKSLLESGKTNGFVNRRSTVQSRPPAPEAAKNSASEATSHKALLGASGIEGYRSPSAGRLEKSSGVSQ